MRFRLGRKWDEWRLVRPSRARFHHDDRRPALHAPLADLGAEVIKIEAPDGDMMRTRPPLRNGASTSFGQLNAGKKSIALDLKSPAAVEAVRRLVATVDVLVENFRPGVMRRFGLDYEALKPIKPDLVYCAISGYGQTGPSAGLPAYAPVIHASSGYDMAHLAYQGDARRPDYCGIYIADVLTGTYAFGAIMAALYQRQATGEGQMIDVSMLESMLTLTLSEIQAAQFAVRPPAGRSSARRHRGRLHQPVDRQRADVPEPGGRLWPSPLDHRSAFCRVPRPARELGSIDRRARGLVDGLTTAEVQAVFDRLACRRRRTARSKAMDDPQLAHRGALAEVHDAGGSFRAMNPPFQMSGTAAARPWVAALGEHTNSLLAEVGYTPADIAALVKTAPTGARG